MFLLGCGGLYSTVEFFLGHNKMAILTFINPVAQSSVVIIAAACDLGLDLWRHLAGDSVSIRVCVK